MRLNKKFILLVFILFPLIFLNRDAEAISFSIGRPDSFAKLAERVGPSVVNIYTTKDVRYSGHPFSGVDPYFDKFFREFFKNHYPNQKRRRQQNSLGSGAIISEDGKIVTNYHVIAGADDIFINLSNGDKVKARLLGTDKKLDLAILQIEKPGSYPHVELGNSEKARVGDWVIAVGNPFGLGQSVSAGIISAKGRVLGAGPYDNFIQTDASINPGNSGGPLFNIDGEVVGINTAIITGGEGISFAIPINMVKQVMNQLITKGKVSRGWLGVSIRDLTDGDIKSLGLKNKKAVYVIDVVPGGPASRNRIRRGDVILKLNGGSVINKQTLPNLIARHQPGSQVRLTVFRGGKEYDLDVVLGDLDNPNKAFIYPIQPKDSSAKSKAEIGIDVRDLESGDSSYAKHGVYVTNVHKNSMASSIGLQRGDVIIELNDDKISSVKDFKKKLKKVDKGDVTKIEVLRGKKTMYFAFRK